MKRFHGHVRFLVNVLPGQPITSHWGVEDPAAVQGTDAERWLAFRSAFKALDNRIKISATLFSVAARG